MISRGTLAAVLLGAAAGVGAYQITLSQRAVPATATAPADPATRALLDWLQVTDAQRESVAREDHGFAGDLARLRAELSARRDALAAAMEDPGTGQAEILARVEAVIAADNELERRVARYLVAVRPHLTAEQQRRLFGLCAQEVRQGGGRQWRGGAGPGSPGPGRGPGPHGRGRGMGWRNNQQP